jgi:hypothetical protein
MQKLDQCMPLEESKAKGILTVEEEKTFLKKFIYMYSIEKFEKSFIKYFLLFVSFINFINIIIRYIEAMENSQIRIRLLEKAS